MKFFILMLLSFSMIGCLKTRSELRGEQPTDSEGRFVTGGNLNQQQRATIDSRFFEINRDFRELYGKIEVIEKKVSDLDEKPAPVAGETISPDQQGKISKLEKRVATLEEALLSLDKKLNGMSGGDKSAKVKKKPKGPFGWGELYFQKGDYAKAITSYDEYRKKYPRGKRYAQATLKMGLSFQKMRMNQDAKAFYKEVIQRYPKTRVAVQAQKNLKKL